MPGLKRVGHKGADLIVPGNTRASFDAALAAGVDMIEFDVLPARPPAGRVPAGGPLILAHDYRDAGGREPHTLAEGLDHLVGAGFAGIELDVDLKLPGYELEVVAALRERGLLARSIISSQYTSSLRAIRAAEPAARLGWSVPRARRDYLRSPFTALPARAALQLYSRTLPRMAAAAIRGGRCDAIMSHWRLVSRALVGAVADAGGELYVWTVDERPRIATLERLGVTGIISNDPRLFGVPAGG